jgi:hypothetical protein
MVSYARSNAAPMEQLPQRLFFIPGFGEDTSVFDKIYPYLEGEKLHIDNWLELPRLQRKNLTVKDYAAYLVDRFRIHGGDVVIGHSMGGWIGLYIKELTGCRVVQIASWTNTGKVVRFSAWRPLVYALTSTGLIFNRLTQHIAVQRYYGKASKEIFMQAMNNLRLRDRSTVIKKLKIIIQPATPLSVSPDLRLHSWQDPIVRPPDEAFVTTPGDHFALYTIPESVYQPIQDFLKGDK